MDFVRKSTVINLLFDRAKVAGGIEYQNFFYDLAKLIEELPDVDAEPVRHARWEWHETWFDETPESPRELFDDGWTCSACGVYLMQYLQSHFPDIPSYAECASDEMPTVERCPCCGAKMDAKDA